MKHSSCDEKVSTHIEAYTKLEKAWNKFTRRMEIQRSKLHMQVEAIKAHKSIETL